MKKPRAIILLCLISCFFICLSAFATDVSDLKTEDQQRYQKTAVQLRCPTCTGLSVLESDAPFSVQIKDLVKEQVKLGKPEQEIVEFFVQRYGPWILREPPRKGFSAIAWVLPLILLCAGPMCIWLFVWRRKKKFQTFGVRPVEEIINEMHQALNVNRNNNL